jgi:hypothetical protein
MMFWSCWARIRRPDKKIEGRKTLVFGDSIFLLSLRIPAEQPTNIINNESKRWKKTTLFFEQPKNRKSSLTFSLSILKRTFNPSHFRQSMEPLNSFSASHVRLCRVEQNFVSILSKVKGGR